MKTILSILPQLIGSALMLFLIFNMDAPWNAAWFAGLALACIGIAFLLTARYQLGKSFSVSAQARHLVTRGIYSRIRNPIYVFSTLAITGLMIAYQHLPYLLFPVGLSIMQMIRAHREAQVLEAAFGDEYRKYRKQTWF